MGRISPGPTRWPPGAERRLVPAKSNLKPQTHLKTPLLNCYYYLLWFYVFTVSEFSCLALLPKP